MENIKVSVKHNDWSEVFDMLVELGAKHKNVKSKYGDNNGWLFVHGDVIWVGVFPDQEKECREVVFRELKDVVVLKRNDVNDRTHVDSTGCDYYQDSNGDFYYKTTRNWKITREIPECIEPIEKKEMKEFLVKHDDKWTLQLLDSDTEENSYRVAVPEGAEILIALNKRIIGFYKNDFGLTWIDDEGWVETKNEYSDWINYPVLWQRSEDFTKATIGGVEAFNAIANDITVQYRFAGGKWKDYTQDLNHDSSNLKAVHFLCDLCEFRYKPKTIVVNGVEYEDEQKAVKVVKDYFKGDVK